MKRLILISLGLLALRIPVWADINVTEGSGKVVPSDTVGGKEYQKIKVVDGVTGGTAGAPVDGLRGMAVYIGSNTVFQGVDHSTGVQVNTGAKYLSIELSTGVTVNGTVTANISGSINNTAFTANQGTAGTAWRTDFSSGVQVNTGGKFLGVDFSSGVKANQGTAGISFWGIDFSTGVNVNGTVIANAGTPGTRFPGVDLSSGIQVNTGGKFLGVDFSSGVTVNGTVIANQGTPSTRFPGVDLSSGVQINTGGKFIGVDFSSGITINGTVTANAGTPGTKFPGVDLSSGIQVNTGGKFLGIDFSSGIKANQGTAGASFWGVDFSSGVKSNQGTAGTSFWGVDFSSGVKSNQGTAGTSFWGIDLSTGAKVNGTDAIGGAPTGNPVRSGLVVSSATLPANQFQGNVVNQMADQFGRAVVVGGAPWDLIKSTFALVMSSRTGNDEDVLVSSPVSPSSYTYLCYCTFAVLNSSMTQVQIETPLGGATRRMSFNTTNNNASIQIGSGCENPFFRSYQGGIIGIRTLNWFSIQQAVNSYCVYYQSP